MTTAGITSLFDWAGGHALPEGPASGPDLDRYRPFVAHLDIPEARKDDIILAIWRIMQNTVDRAFGDDPVQRIGRIEDKSQGLGEHPEALMIGSATSDPIERTDKREER